MALYELETAIITPSMQQNDHDATRDIPKQIIIKEKKDMKQYMRDHNRSERNRRRIQFTLLNFLYAYTRKLSLEIERSTVFKKSDSDIKDLCFFNIYTFIDKDGAFYDPIKLMDCGKSLFKRDFSEMQDSANKTVTKINSINYFLVRMLNIDIKRYTKKLDIRKTIPFVDVDMKNTLYDMMKIDYYMLYKNIQILLCNKIDDIKRYGSIVYADSLSIPYSKINEIVHRSIVVEHKDEKRVSNSIGEEDITAFSNYDCMTEYKLKDPMNPKDSNLQSVVSDGMYISLD